MYTLSMRNTRANYQRQWAKNNPGKRRMVNRRHRRKLRRQVLQIMGNKCATCGYADWRALQIDHINGGGTKEHGKSGCCTYYLKKVERSIMSNEQKYQLLCANCNQIKRYTNQEGYLYDQRTFRTRSEMD